MKKFLHFSLFLCSAFLMKAQYNISSLNIPQTINFNDFKADSAAAPGAIAGINTSWFAVKGFTGTNTVNNFDFGTINNSPKLKLGTSTGGNGGSTAPSASGFYSFRTNPLDTNDRALGFQPTGGDLTPGFIYFKVKNTTGQTISNLFFSFTLEVRNDQGRSNNVQLLYGADTVIANLTLANTYLSTVAADPIITWVDTQMVAIVTGINLAVNAEYYFVIKTDDVAGAGSRDEFAINDISILASGSAPSITLNANFSASDSVVCAGSTVTFTNTTTTVPANITSLLYFWDFKDGGIDSIPNPIHQFNTAGTYNVNLIVVDTVTFTIDSQIVAITVGALPSANFTSSNTGAGAYSFTAPATSASNYTYAWTLNGSAVGGSQPTYSNTFSSSGINSVCLTVINPLGNCKDSICKSVNVVIAPINTLNVQIGLSDSAICVGDSVALTLLNVTGGTAPFTYAWSINGNTTAAPTLNNFTQVNNPGLRTLVLVVTDSNNFTKSDTAKLFVSPLPNANFTATVTAANPAQYIINPTSGSVLLNYSLFVNGTPTTLTGTFPFLYTFPGTGTYNVCLKATNINTTCEDSTCQTVNVLVSSIDKVNRNNQVRIYPNPANEVITIENIKEKSTLKIFNAIGKLVKEEVVTSVSSKLNVKELSAGVYFVEVKSSTYTSTAKLVVQ
jgi:PKD repeat protein